MLNVLHEIKHFSRIYFLETYVKLLKWMHCHMVLYCRDYVDYIKFTSGVSGGNIGGPVWLYMSDPVKVSG